MMKNDIVKYYVGNTILPIGKPAVITVGYLDKNKYVCERFAFFEKLNNQMVKKAVLTSAPQSVFNSLNDSEHASLSLDGFMLQEGLNMAKHDLEGIVVEQHLNGNSEIKLSSVNINLIESELIIYLAHLGKNYPKDLYWLEQNTSSWKLRDSIRLVRGYVIECSTKLIE